MRKLIVGLGNPGGQYKCTRHNAGFLVLDALCSRHHAAWRNSESNHGMLSKMVINDIECSLLMPMTFMNNSGVSVKKLADRQGITPENILVVCDDLDLPFGKLRLRAFGSAGGHNGLKSIIEQLGSNQFARLRMGINTILTPEVGMEKSIPTSGVGTVNMADYVLSNFTPAEIKALPEFINHALDCVTCWVTEGANVAMNQFN